MWKGLLQKHRKSLNQLIAAAARVKAGVVSRDQFEKDERRKLNLGHTFAHAIETLAQNEVLARQDSSIDGLSAEDLHYPDGVTH